MPGRASLDMLEQITPEHPLVRQLRFELEALTWETLRRRAERPAKQGN